MINFTPIWSMLQKPVVSGRRCLGWQPLFTDDLKFSGDKHQHESYGTIDLMQFPRLAIDWALSLEKAIAAMFIWVWPMFPVCGSSALPVKTSAFPTETGFFPCHQELDGAMGPMTAAFHQLMWAEVHEVPTPLSSQYLRFWEISSIFSL